MTDPPNSAVQAAIPGTVRKRLVLGLDEAGRGAVLGPLVVAGVVLDDLADVELKDMGVSDSKHLTPAQRRALAKEIKCLARWSTVVVLDAATVDRRYAERENLDELERGAARDILGKAGEVGRVVADGHRLFEPLRCEFRHLEAIDRGESRCVAVAAASVIAKVCRDKWFASFSEQYSPHYGDLKGGGYGGEDTGSFLRAYFRGNGKLPPETRLSSKSKVVRQLIIQQLRGDILSSRGAPED